MKKDYQILWKVATVLLVLWCFYINKAWSANLPVYEEYSNRNQLEALQKQNLQKPENIRNSDNISTGKGINGGKSESLKAKTINNYNTNNVSVAAALSVSYNNHTNNSTTYTTGRTLGNWRSLPHGSYDKNDDVVSSGKMPTHAPQISPDQRNNFTAYENSNTDDNFEGNNDESDNNKNVDYSNYMDGDDNVLQGNEDSNSNKKDEEQQQKILSRKRRGFDEWFIAPHTRWCGRGNIANNTYNQLGNAADADRCCRRHDHCPLFISAFSSRFELFNYRPYTLSHCNCDRRFRACLKMNNDDTSNMIGELFFNMVPSQCFVLHNERKCLKRDVEGNCVKDKTWKRAIVRDNLKY